MRRALVTVATGYYHSFVEPFISAVGEQRTADLVYVLTDHEPLLSSRGVRRGDAQIRFLPWGSLPWPYPTLWRYAGIHAYREVFAENASHLVYSDIDMKPVGESSALFGPSLVAVRHPGYYDKPSVLYPFSQQADSAAYLPRGGERVYVAGGVQGGEVNAFLAAVSMCRSWILDDFNRGVTAEWHDESHWNRFVNDRRHAVTLLGPEYCWPESWDTQPGTGTPRILALDKDHHALRGTKPGARDRLLQARVSRRMIRRLKPLIRR